METPKVLEESCLKDPRGKLNLDLYCWHGFQMMRPAISLFLSFFLICQPIFSWSGIRAFDIEQEALLRGFDRGNPALGFLPIAPTTASFYRGAALVERKKEYLDRVERWPECSCDLHWSPGATVDRYQVTESYKIYDSEAFAHSRAKEQTSGMVSRRPWREVVAPALGMGATAGVSTGGFLYFSRRLMGLSARRIPVIGAVTAFSVGFLAWSGYARRPEYKKGYQEAYDRSYNQTLKTVQENPLWTSRRVEEKTLRTYNENPVRSSPCFEGYERQGAEILKIDGQCEADISVVVDPLVKGKPVSVSLSFDQDQAEILERLGAQANIAIYSGKSARGYLLTRRDQKVLLSGTNSYQLQWGGVCSSDNAREPYESWISVDVHFIDPATGLTLPGYPGIQENVSVECPAAVVENEQGWSWAQYDFNHEDGQVGLVVRAEISGYTNSLFEKGGFLETVILAGDDPLTMDPIMPYQKFNFVGEGQKFYFPASAVCRKSYNPNKYTRYVEVGLIPRGADQAMDYRHEQYRGGRVKVACQGTDWIDHGDVEVITQPVFDDIDQK